MRRTHSGRVDENGVEMKPLGLKPLINEVTGLASVLVRCTVLAVLHYVQAESGARWASCSVVSPRGSLFPIG